MNRWRDSGGWQSGGWQSRGSPSEGWQSGGWQSRGSPSGGWQSECSPSGGWQARGSPSGGWQSEGSSSGGCQSGGLPKGGWQSRGSLSGGWQSGDWQSEGSPSGGLPKGGRQSRGSLSGGWQSGSWQSEGSPSGGWQSGDLPTGDRQSGGLSLGGWPSGGLLSRGLLSGGLPSGGRHQEAERCPQNQTKKEKRERKKKKVRAPPPKRERSKEEILLRQLPKKERRLKRKQIKNKFIRTSRAGNLDLMRKGIETYHLSPNIITKGLSQAVRSGNLSAVQMLFMYPQSTRRAWSDGLVLIRAALKLCHVEIAKLLLRQGMSVKKHNNKKIESPLDLAIPLGDTELVELLIQDDIKSVSWENSKGQTALHVAAESCKENMVQLLLRHGAVSKKDKFMFEPLQIACFQQQPKIVDILLNHRVESGSSSDPWSLNFALLIASGKEKEGIVLTLLKAGADPNFCLQNSLCHYRYSFFIKAGSTPLLWADKNGRRNIVDILLKHGAQGTSLITKEEENITPMSSATDVGSSMCVPTIKKEAEGNITPTSSAVDGGSSM